MTQKNLRGLFAGLSLIALTLLFFWKILLTNLILSGVDVFLYFYPYKSYVAEALRQGRLPLWNPHLFMGVPLLANSQVGLFYPLNWLFIWLDAPKQVAWSIGLHIILAGGFMLMFVRQSLRFSWPASLLAAVLFAFGGYLNAQVEHVNQLQAAAWLPLLFLLFDLGLRPHRRLRWLLLLALVIALMLLAGHAQTVFISLFGLGLYGLWQALFEPVDGNVNHITGPLSKPTLPSIYPSLRPYLISLPGRLFRHLWPLAAASVLAAALAAIQLLPTVELSSLSIRSGGLTLQETVSFSLHPSKLHFTLLPPINVDLTQIMGDAFGEWVAYLGISGLSLAIVGALIAIRQPAARRFAFLSGSGLILSFGLYTGPLYVILYTFVPGFNLFRVPARWLLLYAFGMAVLASFALEALHTIEPRSGHLATIQQWIGARWRRLVLLLIIPAIGFVALFLRTPPPLSTAVIWLTLTAIAAALISYTSRNPSLGIFLIVLVIIELFWSAQSLNFNQPTAPQAFHSMRNATAFLLANDPPHQNTPPARFLSLSGITYDPGDLRDLQHIFSDTLSERALYNLVVANKEKEVLFFNLPLVYGLHSVDGYDGGVLPLTQFISLQQLFLGPDDLSIDGRLRENLRTVPANRLLSLLNTRWIITDKLFDVWIDGVFYDLQFPARLASSQTIGTSNLPTFSATAIGLVSHLEVAPDLPNNSPVAEITLKFADGSQDVLILKAGADTAEGLYPTNIQLAHPQATLGVTWPHAEGGVDYITVHQLSSLEPVVEISVKAVLPSGQFVLQGISLIHQPTTTSRSIMLSTEGDYRQVHSGDVKIYENRAALSRAFIVHQIETVSSADQAIATMQNRNFDPSRTALVMVEEKQLLERTSGVPSPHDTATIISYMPERVEIAASLASPGWLVLTDTNYPGWQASIDGQPLEILTANIMFRAVALPEGRHTVVFEFKPGSFQGGALISGVALLGILIGLGISLNQV